MGKAHKMRRVGAKNAGRLPFQNPLVSVVIAQDGQTSTEVRPAVGSSLLQRLAAQTWHDVTGGAGVTLVDGKPVPVKGGKS